MVPDEIQIEEWKQRGLSTLNLYMEKITEMDDQEICTIQGVSVWVNNNEAYQGCTLAFKEFMNRIGLHGFYSRLITYQDNESFLSFECVISKSLVFVYPKKSCFKVLHSVTKLK